MFKGWGEKGSKDVLCDYGGVVLGLHLRRLRELGEIAGGGRVFRKTGGPVLTQSAQAFEPPCKLLCMKSAS